MNTRISVEKFLSDAKKTMRRQMPKYKIEESIAEAKDHLECQIESDLARGISREDAEKRALAAFESPSVWADSIAAGCYDNRLSRSLAAVIIAGSALMGLTDFLGALYTIYWRSANHPSIFNLISDIIPTTLFTLALLAFCFFGSIASKETRIKPLLACALIFGTAIFAIDGLHFRKSAAFQNWYFDIHTEGMPPFSSEENLRACRMKARYERSECDLLRLGLKTYADYAPGDAQIQQMIDHHTPLPSFPQTASLPSFVLPALKSRNAYIAPLSGSEREMNGGVSALKIVPRQIGETDKEIDDDVRIGV